MAALPNLTAAPVTWLAQQVDANPGLLLDWIDAAGTLGVLVLIIWTGSKRDKPGWVFGHVYEAKQREVELWQRIALKNLALGETAASASERAITHVVSAAPEALETAAREALIELLRKRGEER